MDLYDIFRESPDGSVWVESVAENKIAGRLTALYETEPGRYFAYDVRGSRVVAKFPP